MAKRQRLTLRQVLDEIFLDPLNEDAEEDHLKEDYCDSAEYSSELDKELPNEVTDTGNEPIRSTEKKNRLSLNCCAGLCGGCGHIPGSFALLLCHFLNITVK